MSVAQRAFSSAPRETVFTACSSRPPLSRNANYPLRKSFLVGWRKTPYVNYHGQGDAHADRTKGGMGRCCFCGTDFWTTVDPCRLTVETQSRACLSQVQSREPPTVAPIMNCKIRSKDGTWLWRFSVSRNGQPFQVIDWQGVVARPNQYVFTFEFTDVENSAWIGPYRLAQFLRRMLWEREKIQTEINALP